MKWLKYLPILLILFFVFWTGRGLFKYEFFYTHDIKHHLVRSYDAVATIREGHFPLRWAGIINYECGVPIYNFYNPILYYLVILINILTPGLMTPIKIISFLSLLIGTLFFYLWLKNDTGSKWASWAGAMLYLFAPYRFLLVYVRGSPEYLAYAFLPVSLYFYSKIFNSKKHVILYAFLAALTGTLMSLSHNIVMLFGLPIIFGYLGIKVFLEKPEAKKIWVLIFSFISIIGLGAFFIFPAVLESSFTKLNIPIFNYQDHFPTLLQLIKSKWGYGDSGIGLMDDMSFQFGYSQWLVLFIGLLATIAVMGKINLLSKNLFLVFFFLLGVSSLYLILPISLPLWNKIKLLQTIQFSWRLLGVSVFATAALFAFVLAKIKSRLLLFLLITAVIGLSIFENRNHLLPQPILETDLSYYQDLESLNYKRRSVSAIAETVLPINAPFSCYINTPIVTTIDGRNVEFDEKLRGSTYGEIILTKTEGLKEKVILNLSYFPGIYDFRINNNKAQYSDCEGRLCFDAHLLKDGSNVINWRIGQSRTQNIFNFLSLSFLAIWGILLIRYYWGRYSKL